MGKTIKKIFTEEELRQIPQMYKDGLGVMKIAEQMHTSYKRIRKILLENGIDYTDPSCR